MLKLLIVICIVGMLWGARFAPNPEETMQLFWFLLIVFGIVYVLRASPSGRGR